MFPVLFEAAIRAAVIAAGVALVLIMMRVRPAALRHRVHITEDATMSAVAPRLRPARVTLTLKDGRQSIHACESHRGDFQQPFEESELREKFHELAGTVLTPDGVAHVEEAVGRCEQWKSVRELTDLMRRYGRT